MLKYIKVLQYYPKLTNNIGTKVNEGKCNVTTIKQYIAAKLNFLNLKQAYTLLHLNRERKSLSRTTVLPNP